MCRFARKESETGMYHIICKSYVDSPLFREDKDKEVYLNLLKFYMEAFLCSIYSYTLMSTHLHLFIDAKGFPISKFMQSLNSSYAIYYKCKYKREGSVFLRRFKSKVVENASYATSLSSYIHKNAKDIEGFFGCEENYVYSSYGIYAGLIEDKRGIIDMKFMKGLFQIDNDKEFQLAYLEFVKNKCGILNYDRYIDITTIETEKISFERNFTADEIIEEVEEKYGKVDVEKEKLSDAEYLVIYFLRAMSCYTYSEICKLFVRQKIENCLVLVQRGMMRFRQNEVFQSIFYSLIKRKIKNIKGTVP